MKPLEVGKAIFGIFVIFSATVSALSLAYGLGLRNYIALGIVGGGAMYATMRLLDRA